MRVPAHPRVCRGPATHNNRAPCGRPSATSRRSMLDHSFNGPPFTIGIEEELMLLHEGGLSLAQEIEAILEAVPEDREGQVKPELMQSVLEIATKPCRD